MDLKRASTTTGGNLREFYRPLLPNMRCATPARIEDVERAEIQIGFQLPDEYRNFLTLTDGLDGYLNEKSFLSLWGSTELPTLNKAYEVAKNAEGLLLIGSNGCGEALAYDYLDAGVSVVQVPFVGLSRRRIDRRAATLLQYVRALGPPNPSKPLREKENELVEIKPIVLGGDPGDPANKTFLDREHHIQYVTFWNRILREAEST
jgi:hypothetical protein